MIKQLIAEIKLAKAEQTFEQGIAIYGTVENRLRSLDCKTRDEAIKMLAKVQQVKIHKINGKVVVE
jgi:hypothetical protein